MPEKTFHSLTLPGLGTARVPLTANEFSIYTNYVVNDYCTYQGKLYKCVVAHTAGSWNTSHFAETTIGNEIGNRLAIPAAQDDAPENPRVGDLWIDTDANSPVYNVDTEPSEGSTNAVSSNGVKAALDALDDRKVDRNVLAGDYSSSATYKKNDLAMNGSLMYRCLTDILTPEEWNQEHWTATTLNTELIRTRAMARYIIDTIDSEGNITFSENESFADIQSVLMYGGIVTAVVFDTNARYFIPLTSYWYGTPLHNDSYFYFANSTMTIQHNQDNTVIGKMLPR